MDETGPQFVQASSYNPYEHNGRHFDEGLQVAQHKAGLQVVQQTAGPGGGGLETLNPNFEDRLPAIHDPEKLDASSTGKSDLSQNYIRISKRTFWVGLIALILVVAGIAVGAGVGVSKHSTTTTPSPDSSTTLSATPSTTSSAASVSTSTSGGCVNGTTYVSSVKAHFQEVCDTDFGVGDTHNTTAADIAYVGRLSTFEGCMDACGLFLSAGISVPGVGGKCHSVAWISSDTKFGDCYLKNATALIGSSNTTAETLHARPVPSSCVQSANMVDDDGNML